MNLDLQLIDPTLVQMGVLLGLIDAKTQQFNTDWFSDPLKYIHEIPSERAGELVKLLQGLLGGSNGSALSTPQALEIAGRSWYPIQASSSGQPEDTAPTGIYVVSQPLPSDTTKTIMGVGFLQPLTEGSIVFTPYITLPLVELPGSQGTVFENLPIEIGVSITNSQGPFGSADAPVTFNGVKIATEIYLNGKVPNLEIVILNLKLPGEQAGDRSLIALIEQTIQLQQDALDEWITIALSLLATQVSNALASISPTASRAAIAITVDLLSLFGITGDLPALNWEALLHQKATFSQTFLDWLLAITSSPDTLKAWLNELYALLHGSVVDSQQSYVTGTGTRADPWAIPIFSLRDQKDTPKAGLDLTMAVERSATDQTLQMYPGVRIGSAVSVPIAPLADKLAAYVAASVEVAQLTLAGEGVSIPPVPLEQRLVPNLQLMAVAANPTPGTPLLVVDSSSGEALAAGANTSIVASEHLFSLDTIQAGFAYGIIKPGDTSRTFSPTFTLTNVQSSIGAWPSVDLTNFDQTVQVIEEAISALIQKAISTYLGPKANRFAQSLEAVLGVLPPAPYTLDTWPVKNLLLSPNTIDLVARNPLAALGSYYTRCLTTPLPADSGAPAWQALLPDLAIVLSGVTAGASQASGIGTPEDPWSIDLVRLSAGGPVAALLAWYDAPVAGQPAPRLHMALGLSIPFAVSVATIEMRAVIEALALSLPDAQGQGSMSGTWLPGLVAQLRVAGQPQGGKTQPLATPSLAGISLQISDSVVSAGWSRAQGVYAQAAVQDIEILAAGLDPVKVGDLVFDLIHPSTWSEQNLAVFAQVIVNTIGLSLLEHGGRFGLLLTSALGLLPNLPSVLDGADHPDYPFAVPPGLKLPSAWPVFDVSHPETFFTNPWDDLRAHLGKLFASGARVEPLLQLTGWAITGSVPTAPQQMPAGTFADPWSVLLPNVWSLEPLLWTETAVGDAGPDWIGGGLRRIAVAQTASDLTVTSQVRADIARLRVGAAVVAPAPPLPRLTALVDLRDPSGQPLVNRTIQRAGLPDQTITIASANLGVFIDLTDLDGAGFFSPVLMLNGVQIDGQDLGTVRLEREAGSPIFSASQPDSVLETLLFALLETLSDKLLALAGTLPLLQSSMLLLVDLGLLQATTIAGVTRYSLSALAWQALLSNPKAYLEQQAGAIFLSPERSASFFAHIRAILGLEHAVLPAALTGLPQLLTALGLLVPIGDSYGLVGANWLALLRSPVQYIEQVGARLLNDPAVRKQLLTELGNLSVLALPNPDVPLSLSVAGGAQIQITTSPQHPIQIGAELMVVADLIFDLQNLSLTVNAGIAAPALDAALLFRDTLTIHGTGQPANQIAFMLDAPPTDLPPAFDPLVFYPLPDTQAVGAYLAQLGVRLPITVLSIVASKLLNTYVLPRYPFATRLFVDLGLAEQVDGKPAAVRSLVDVFMHPVDWFLSPQALGDGQGGINLSRVGSLLHDLPDPSGTHGPDGIVVTPVDTTGLQVSGLPFGVSAKLGAAASAGVGMGMAIDWSLAGSRALEAGLVNDLTFKAALDLSFGLAAGLHVSGQVQPGLVLDDDGTSVALSAAYQNQRFTVDLIAQLGSNAPNTIALVPFGGLNQFIPNAGTTQALLQFVASTLTKPLNSYLQGHPASDPLVVLIKDAQAVGAVFGITSAATLIHAVQSIADNPLAWLSQPFSNANIGVTLKTINDLLGQAGLSGFTISGTLLVYQPAIPTTLGTLQIMLGTQTISGKTVLGVWVEPQLKQQWIVLDIKAGAGAVVPFDQAKFDFTLELGLGTDLSFIPNAPITNGPELRFGLTVDNTGKLDPTLALYPVGVGASHDTLIVALIPQVYLAYGDASTTQVPVEQWLVRFAVQFLVPFVVDTVLRIDAVNTLLTTSIGATNVSPGLILNNWKLLNQVQQQSKTFYQLTDLMATYGGMKPLEIVELIAYGTLTSFVKATGSVPLVTFKSGSIFIAGVEDADKRTQFGIGVRVEDIVLTGKTSPNQTKNPSVELMLQLGKWLQGEGSGGQPTWLSRVDPDWKGGDDSRGIILYMVSASSASDITFQPRIELVSIGFDIRRQNQAPLVNVNGFQLGALEPRIYFTLGIDPQQGKLSDLQFGGALRVDGLGVPVGPGFGTQTAGEGSSSNPVAGNLLASSAPPKDGQSNPNNANRTAVNPTFSVSGGYVEKFDLKLYNDQQPDVPTNQVLIPIQRQFGPLQIRKLGIGWEADPKLLDLIFDGNVSLLGLSVSLEDLTIGVPITNPGDYSAYRLDLAGLSISFQGGPVQVSGGFLKVEGNPYPAYNGLGLVKAASFSLGAIGSYTVIATTGGEGAQHLAPSLMVFAFLRIPIGGPPYFSLTGVAAGFGFNRGFVPPALDKVQVFPLVAAVQDPSVLGGGDSITTVLKALGDAVPPELGVYWLAAGINFTSFETIDAFALLIVEFGKEFQIVLLGLASIQLPKKSLGLHPYIYAELGLRVVLNPAQGILQVSAVLTPNSYLIDQSCRLTGGFAFFVWFRSQEAQQINAGDFVLTLGGYGPTYDKPAHYPDIPRIGFRWEVSSVVLIKGEAYFALTPREVMAGGRLEATYHSGDLRAWFIAYMDALIGWEPFHYFAQIGINIGVSYTLRVVITKTFTISLGVEVQLWGPRLRGVARVTWWVISFTVSFGDESSSKDPPKAISWTQFDSAFLPKPAASTEARRARLMATADTAPADQSETVKSRISGGLIRTVKIPAPGVGNGQDQIEVSVVRADQLVITTESSIPATQISFVSAKDKPRDPIKPDPQYAAVGVRPMASGQVTSIHQLQINKIDVDQGLERLAADGTGTPIDISAAAWSFSAATNGVPAALWATTTDISASPTDALLPNRLVGLGSGSPLAQQQPPPLPPIDIKTNLSYTTVLRQTLPLHTATGDAGLALAAALQTQENSLQVIQETVMAPAVVDFRAQVLAAVIGMGVNVITDVHQDVLAANAELTYQSAPMLGPLGSPGQQVTATAAPALVRAGLGMARRARALETVAPPRAPRLRALLRRYARPATRAVAAGPTSAETLAHGAIYPNNALAVQRWSALGDGMGARAAQPQQLSIQPGTTLMWELPDHAGPGHTLQLDQRLSVRITSFDRHHELVEDEILDQQAQGVYQVPAPAYELLITGLEPGSTLPGRVGWERDMLLIQANPVMFVGEGVVVRSQAPQQMRQGRYQRTYGLVSGRTMVEQNRVSDPRTAAGWVRGGVLTWMPGDVAELELRVLAEDGATLDQDSLAELFITWAGAGGERTAFAQLAPQAVVTGDGVAQLTYRVPAESRPSAGARLGVFVRTAATVSLSSVAGIRPELDRAARLETGGAPLGHARLDAQPEQDEPVASVVQLFAAQP